MWTYKSCCLELLWKNKKTGKTVANRCKKLQRNGTKTKNERRFDVTLGYSITVRDVTAFLQRPWQPNSAQEVAAAFSQRAHSAHTGFSALLNTPQLCHRVPRARCLERSANAKLRRCLCACLNYAPVNILPARGGGGHTRGFRQKTIPDRREFDKLMESGSRVI